MKSLLLTLITAITCLTGFGQTAEYQKILMVYTPQQLLQSKTAVKPSFPTLNRNISTLAKPGLEEVYTWYSTIWHHRGDFHYTYDAAGNEIKSIVVDAATNQNVLRRIKTYNSVNQETSEVEELWNGFAWTDPYKTETVYDVAGNRISKVGLLLNGTTWDTISAEKHLYKYNSAGSIIEEIFMDWDSVWFPVRKIVSTPDVNGEWIDYTDYIWDNGSWTPNHKVKNIVWHNFSEKEPEIFTLQQWDSTGWYDAEQYIATYTTYNCFTAITKSKNSLGNWENQTRLSINYDAQNNYLGFIYDIWMINHWSFMAEQRFLLTYDSNLNLTESIRQWRDLNDPAVYLNEIRRVYGEYPAVSASHDEVSSTKFSAWPNPVISTLSISLTDVKSGRYNVEVSDLAGKVVYTRSEVITDTVPLGINLEKLPSGVYLLRIRGMEEALERKIIKL